ncbi:hypothetical protein TNCV_3183401 [Trichonephila clavipes]|uniref:Uncharacterized protein n=1 Tax=Trichonephila clavipes TaxID=2585209 RepID=A0A8X6SM01_TRICX|nr:hypothetical protein TNCV_3183401 [Trichonephila clavipes]
MDEHPEFDVGEITRKLGVERLNSAEISNQEADCSGGEGKTPPKAARIRHPKIPPLKYAARGEESLRQGVTNKQKFQSTVSRPRPDGVRGGYRTERVRTKALPTFSKRMDETFSTPLADQQQKKKLFTK